MGEVIPAAAHAFLPLLIAVQGALWPAAHDPWVMAAQVERETCPSFTSKMCWSPRAELKTSRENGIGFGQVTRAYNADGSIRFDKQAELRAAHQELRGWTWERRYDPRLQMTGLVLMDRSGWTRFEPLSATPADTWAMALSGFNGGDGGVLKDRLLCKKEPACDPTRWSGNVERYSTKSRAKWQGYGQSAFDINRGYVRQVLQRAPAYAPHWVAGSRTEMASRWSEQEKQFLRDNYRTMTAEQIAHAIGRDRSSVYEMARRAGIKKLDTPRMSNPQRRVLRRPCFKPLEAAWFARGANA